MTELERFAAALLAQWQSQGGGGGGPIAVGEILERILPYRVARRLVGIEASEDYEALMLRLIAEEGDLVRTEPVDAADMAKATINSKLPDLDVLQLLRAASVTITPRAAVTLAAVAAKPVDASPALRPPEPPSSATTSPLTVEVVEAVVPMVEAPVLDADSPRPSVVAEPPPQPEPKPSPRSSGSPSTSTWAPHRYPAPTDEEPTSVTTPAFAAEDSCWSCHEPLPPGRDAKFCPLCGADQRQPACASCGAPVERRWKHCPDCGVRLGGER
ncbi:MAG TPA: zinc ribbon domain-containing protein [Gemmatimonadales bacterium]